MKKLLLACLTTLFATATWANGTTVGDLHYLFDDDALTATVTYTGTTANSTTDYSGDIVIPETVDYEGKTYTVTAIGASAFRGDGTITSITIPESVTSIGEYAFYYYGYGDDAKSITIPESVTSIGQHAFSYYSVDSITLPSGLTEMANYLFQYASLKKVTYNGAPESDTMIQFPPACTSIGEYTFSRCTDLEGTLVIPATITAIDAYAFETDDGISAVIFEESDTPITCLATTGQSMFNSCSGLETAYIYRDFELLSGKQNGPFEGSAASTAAKVKKAVFGGKATNVCGYCFRYCATLEKVVFEEDCKVTEFGTYAFSYCTGLTEVVIPATVTTVGDYCFRSCTELSSVYSLKDTHPSVGGTYVFRDVTTSACTLYVPVGSYDSYSSSSPWNGFNIVEMAGTLSITDAEYATFYADYAYIMPEGVTGTTVVGVEGAAGDGGYYLDMYWEYDSGETVPAHTALVLKGTTSEYSYAITVPYDDTPTDNLLMGSATETTTYGPDEEASYVFYELTNGDHGIGFYYANEGGEVFTSAANKAWLPLDVNTARGAKFIGFDRDNATGITAVEGVQSATNGAIYTIQGVRVSDMDKKGIYIVDGKKVLVK